MIGLPKTTEFNRRIPKQKFYENIDITPHYERYSLSRLRLSIGKTK